MISDNFSRKEMACKCGCGFDTADYQLILVLEDIRKHFEKPIRITSGCRCIAYNKKIGGSKNSKHTLGRAADIQIKDVLPKTIYDYLNQKYSNEFGFGLYDSFVHVDTRNEKVRWTM